MTSWKEFQEMPVEMMEAQIKHSEINIRQLQADKHRIDLAIEKEQHEIYVFQLMIKFKEAVKSAE